MRAKGPSLKAVAVSAKATWSRLPAGAVQSGISVLPSQYPPVWREDNVTQDFFGTIVSDPYRWLEDTDSNATLACAKLLATCVRTKKFA